MGVVYAASGKRDFHELERMFDERLLTVKNAAWEHEENRQLVIEYIEQCRRGMVKSRGRASRVRKSTLYRVLGILELLSESWLRADFATATQADWDGFYIRMEDGKILNNAGKPFRQSTRAKNYKTIQKFLRWIGRSEHCENWDTREETPSRDILTRGEVEQMLTGASTRMQCIIMMLFDGGFRAEELGNLRWTDLHQKPGAGYYQATVRKETTKTRRGRVVSLWLATDHITAYKASLEHTRTRKDGDYLYEGDYASLFKAVKRLGQRTLGKNISPHTLRHSSATYYAGIIKTYQNFCYRYGWTLKSGIAQRYWHPTSDDEVAEQTKEHEIARFKTDFERVRLHNTQLQDQLDRMRQEINALNKFKTEFFQELIQSGEADRILKAYKAQYKT